jgi:hypothetical protein
MVFAHFNGDASRSLLLTIGHLRLTFSLLCGAS